LGKDRGDEIPGGWPRRGWIRLLTTACMRAGCINVGEKHTSRTKWPAYDFATELGDAGASVVLTVVIVVAVVHVSFGYIY